MANQKRLFLLDADGKEFNLLFARENQLIGDLSSPAKTKFNLSSIEKSIVYEIDNDKLERMNKGLSNSNSLGDYMRRSYIFLQNRLVDILSKSAEENYENLLKDNSELLNRLPQYHIASYLGISPEFLSKTIAKVVKKH